MRRLKALLAGMGALVVSATGAQAQDFGPRITRDAYGVPTVHGRTDAEAAYGVALAHAQEDFATMQQVVLGARGRLGAHLGRDGAASDFLWHLLRVEETVKDGYQRVSPETRALAEAYAAGLNAYAAAHPKESIADARNVTGRDVIAGFTLTSPLFYGMGRVLGPLLSKEGRPCSPTASGPPAREERGSNAFAIAPLRSADGYTRLVVNSHQPWDGPVAWWEVKVTSDEGWSMHGGVFPGSPVPLLGANDALGYAATVNFPDLIDLYRLRTDPARKEQYFYDGEWRQFEIKKVRLWVKQGPIRIPVSRTLRFAAQGPVFETADGFIAVRYAGMGETRNLEQYYRMSKARTFAEWRAALELRAVPSTNLIYADRTGKIAFYYNASFPMRAAGHDWRGCVRGDTSANVWNTLAPLSQNPIIEDPKSGFVFSANAAPFLASGPEDNLKPAAFPESFGLERHMTNRALRSEELFALSGKISAQDLHAIKYDLAYSPRSDMARAVAEILAADVGADADLIEAQRVLRAWNFRTDQDNRGAALAQLMWAPIHYARRDGKPMPPPLTTLRPAIQALKECCGKLDPPWGEVLRLRRGAHDLPLSGGPDTLRAIGWTKDTDGKLRADFGDGLTMFVAWAPDGGKTTDVIHQFGAAQKNAASPHFADQSPLFAQLLLRRWGAK
jgi:penicillin amidase/acyl-homoserine-lactone acylase